MAALDPLSHYINHGAKEGRDPHPLFKADWYLRANADVVASGANPLLHFVERGQAEGRKPNPLFDPGWYLQQHADLAASDMNALQHYYLHGERENHNPHPLFQVEFYRRSNQDVAATKGNLLAHFLDFGLAEDRQPNPLFDPVWYRASYPDVEGVIDLVSHYSTIGVKENRNPHPLFDAAWYVAKYPELAANGGDPLADYLMHEKTGDRQPNLLFDPAWYLRCNPDIATSELQPLQHYVLFGDLEGRSPHPLFDVLYYRLRNPDVDARTTNLLGHYLERGRAEDRQPNSLFVPAWYRARYSDVDQVGADPLSHFINYGAAEGRDPHPQFDTDWYAGTYLAGVPKSLNPLVHYLTKGRRQGYKRNAREMANALELTVPSESVVMPASSMSRRPLVVLITHDCSLTGAPVVMLHLARALVELKTVDLMIYGKVGGFLAAEFARIAPFKLLGPSNPVAELRESLAAFGQHAVKIALCNTVVTTDLLETLRQHDFWTVSLIHEMPLVIKQFGSESFLRADTFADAIICGSAFVRDALIEAYRPKNPHIFVVPTGYAARIPSTSEVQDCRVRLRVEADLPPDSFVVVACGTVDHRKGVDLFTMVAKQVRSIDATTDIRFVWIGDGPSPYSDFCIADTRKAGLSDVVRFIGVRSDIARYLPGADLFALTSREDPFPLVNLAAMSAAVPSLVFKGAGGAVEAVADGAGVVLDYLDVQGMAQAIVKFARLPLERERVGLLAQRRFEERYTVQKFVDGLSDVLAQIGATVNLLGGRYGRQTLPAQTGSVQTPTRRLNADVSVIIPSYNHALYIEKAIRSVLDQNDPLGELVIIDDCSSDGSDALIRSIVGNYDGPTVIRYERLKHNGGAHSAIMRGLSMARGEILAILNSDDFYASDRFSTILASVPASGDFLAFSGVDFVAGDGHLAKEDSGIRAWYAQALRDTIECPTVGYALLRNNIAVTSGNLVFTRSLYQKVGGFARYRMCHDWDFVMRATHFVEPTFVQKIGLYYRVHLSNTLHSTRHLLREEGLPALNTFIELSRNVPAPNCLSPSSANWPIYFEYFIDSHSSWFGKESIRTLIRQAKAPSSKVTGEWRFAIPNELAELGFLEKYDSSQDALALRRDLALRSRRAVEMKVDFQNSASASMEDTR